MDSSSKALFLGGLLWFCAMVLTVLILIFNRIEPAQTKHISVLIDDISYLSVASKVKIGTLTVGTITDIYFGVRDNRIPRQKTTRIELAISINAQDAWMIDRNSEWFINAHGFLGGQHLGIIQPDSNTPLAGPIQDGDRFYSTSKVPADQIFNLAHRTFNRAYDLVNILSVGYNNVNLSLSSITNTIARTKTHHPKMTFTLFNSDHTPPLQLPQFSSFLKHQDKFIQIAGLISQSVSLGETMKESSLFVNLIGDISTIINSVLTVQDDMEYLFNAINHGTGTLGLLANDAEISDIMEQTFETVLKKPWILFGTTPDKE